MLLGKLYVFAFTWSFGGNFRRHDEIEDDGVLGRKGTDRRETIEIDIATEFDNFVHELFEIEPPLGKHHILIYNDIYRFILIGCSNLDVQFLIERVQGRWRHTPMLQVFECQPPAGQSIATL